MLKIFPVEIENAQIYKYNTLNLNTATKYKRITWDKIVVYLVFDF